MEAQKGLIVPQPQRERRIGRRQLQRAVDQAVKTQLNVASQQTTQVALPAAKNTQKSAKKRAKKRRKQMQKNLAKLSPQSGSSIARAGLQMDQSHLRALQEAISRSGGSSRVQMAALAQVAPELRIPFRVPSSFNQQPTAVAFPWSKITTDWAVGDPADFPTVQPISYNQSVAWFFRDPMCSIILTDPNVGLKEYTYTLAGLDVTLADADDEQFGSKSPTTVFRILTYPDKYSIVPFIWGFTTPGTDNYSPHGPIVFCGMASKGGYDINTSHYVWVDPHGTVHFQFLDGVDGKTVKVVGQRYTQSLGFEPNACHGTCVISGGEGEINLTDLQHGDYQFSITYDGDPTTQENFITLNGVTVSNNIDDSAKPVMVFRHLAINDLDKNMGSIDALRENALSLKITNRAAPQYRGGYVAGCQMPAGSRWDDFIVTDCVGYVQNRSGEDDISFEEGFEMFMKPSSKEVFDFQKKSHVAPGLGAWNYAARYILPDQDFCVIAASVRSSDLLSRDSYWTLSIGTEYLSEDVWRETAYPTLTVKEFEEAMAIACAIPQYHTNKFHLVDIWNAIKKYTPIVSKTVDALTPVFEGLLPMLM
jgi:hypothetical protein